VIQRFIKPGLLVAYLACDWQAISDRIGSLGVSAGLVVYFGLYAILLLGLFGIAYIRQTWLRIGLASVFVGASIALHSYEWVTGQPLDYAAFEMMLASRGDTGDAVQQHGEVLLKASAAALLLFAGVALGWKGRRLPLKLCLGAPLVGLIALSGLLYARGGEGGRALPAPFIPLAHASIMSAVSMTEAGGERHQVSFKPSGAKPDHDIVLIVDESISATYLDIDNPFGVYSGLANPRPGIRVSNFGIAAAITDCSPGSNKTLRFGGRRDNYRLIGKAYPSIWAYAKKAGLRTVYLDGQRNDGVLQNLATPEERAEIDDFVQLDGVPVVDRDPMLADLLSKRLANGVPEFIYVNKVGAHFPVADKFPDSAAQFGPLPVRGMTGSITDMGPIHGSHKGTADEWRLYRNAYRNTLIWNVGEFFDRLLKKFDPKSGVLIYTSDHGQDLHERGNPGKTTHCINDPLSETGAVPLVVIDDPKGPRLDWTKAAKVNFNSSSHFRIYPTLLSLMGYAPQDVLPLYGPSLISTESDPMTFTINYFAALGKAPTWRKVDVAKLAAPPQTDFVTSPHH
jgi:Sulfatase